MCLHGTAHVLPLLLLKLLLHLLVAPTYDGLETGLLLHLTMLPGSVWIRKGPSGNVMYCLGEPKKNGTEGD